MNQFAILSDRSARSGILFAIMYFANVVLFCGLYQQMFTVPVHSTREGGAFHVCLQGILSHNVAEKEGRSPRTPVPRLPWDPQPTLFENLVLHIDNGN